MYDLWRCFNFRYQKIKIAGNTLKQAGSTAFTYCKNISIRSPKINEVINRANITDDRIYFPNTESVITSITSEINDVQGEAEGLNVAHKTELGENAPGADSNWSIMASSIGDAFNGVGLLDSTIGENGSEFNNLVELALSGADPSIGISYINYRDLTDAVDNNLSDFIDGAWLRSRAIQMLPAMFKRYHLNQAVTDSDLLFSRSDIESIPVQGLSYPLHPKTVQKSILSRFAGGLSVNCFGLDRALSFSKHGDRTIGVMVAKGWLNDDLLYQGIPKNALTPELKLLLAEDPFEYWILGAKVFENSMPGEIQQEILTWKTIFGLANVSLETYQANDLHLWCGTINQASELVNPTQGVQVDMFTRLHRIMTMRRLHSAFNVDPLLLAELENFPYELKNGKPVFGLDRKKTVEFTDFEGNRQRLEINDDFVYALALAIYGLRNDVRMMESPEPEIW